MGRFLVFNIIITYLFSYPLVFKEVELFKWNEQSVLKIEKRKIVNNLRVLKKNFSWSNCKFFLHKKFKGIFLVNFISFAASFNCYNFEQDKSLGVVSQQSSWKRWLNLYCWSHQVSFLIKMVLRLRKNQEIRLIIVKTL